MHVLLDLECGALLLHLHTDNDVQVLGLSGCLLVVLTILVELGCIGVLYVVASVVTVSLYIYTLLNKVIIQFVHYIVLTLEVDHWTCFTFLINKEQAWDVSILSHLGVIGTEGWSDMYDTSTILGSYIVTRDYAECFALHLNKLILAILAGEYLLRMCCSILLNIVGSILIELSRWFYPRHQLLVLHTYQLLTGITAYDAVRNKLLALVVLRHLVAIGDVTLG